MMSGQVQDVDVRRKQSPRRLDGFIIVRAHDLKFHSPERERSAKPLCVGSIPTRASKFPQQLTKQLKFAGTPTGSPLREFPAQTSSHFYRVNGKLSRNLVPKMTADHLRRVVCPRIENMDVIVRCR